jgi:hypothetical protein
VPRLWRSDYRRWTEATVRQRLAGCGAGEHFLEIECKLPRALHARHIDQVPDSAAGAIGGPAPGGVANVSPPMSIGALCEAAL